MSASIGVRGIQLVGTLLLTYFLMPDLVGEVANAAILTFTVNQFILLGVPQYLITRRRLEPGVAFHGLVVVLVAGVAATALAFLLSDVLGPVLSGGLKSPSLMKFLPGLIAAAMMQRLALIPERLLQRQMKFRTVSLVRGGGEFAYTVVSLALAYAGFGGMAIVLANVARSGFWLLFMGMQVPWRDWLLPTRLKWSTFSAMMAFGLPASVAMLSGIAARSWDNLLISGMFGAAVVGVYNLAYNLADIPATQVGEQIIDVLTPSLAQLEAEPRKAELVRATGLTGLVVFPMAVGLGAVAPTLVSTALRPEWADVAPMLMVLSALAVTRPVGWTVSTYLAASDRPRVLMVMSLVQVVTLLAAIFALGRAFGPLWAGVGVGVGFGVHALLNIAYVVRADGIPAMRFVRNFVQPLGACVPMVGAVLVVRYLLAAVGLDIRGLNLVVEVLVGGGVYVVAALTIARPLALDLIMLIREAVKKRHSIPPASVKVSHSVPG